MPFEAFNSETPQEPQRQADGPNDAPQDDPVQVRTAIAELTKFDEFLRNNERPEPKDLLPFIERFNAAIGVLSDKGARELLSAANTRIGETGYHTENAVLYITCDPSARRVVLREFRRGIDPIVDRGENSKHSPKFIAGMDEFRRYIAGATEADYIQVDVKAFELWMLATSADLTQEQQALAREALMIEFGGGKTIGNGTTKGILFYHMKTRALHFFTKTPSLRDSADPADWGRMKIAMLAGLPLEQVRMRFFQQNKIPYFQSQDSKDHMEAFCKTYPGFVEKYWNGPLGLGSIAVR